MSMDVFRQQARVLPCSDCGHDYRLHRTSPDQEWLGSCNVPQCNCYEYQRDPTTEGGEEDDSA